MALLVAVLVAVAAPWSSWSPVGGEECGASCVTVDHEGGASPCVTDPACAGSVAGGFAVAGLLAVLAVGLAPAPSGLLLGLVPAVRRPAAGRVDRRRLLRPPQPSL